jgi:hypothetical protein
VSAEKKRSVSLLRVVGQEVDRPEAGTNAPAEMEESLLIFANKVRTGRIVGIIGALHMNDGQLMLAGNGTIASDRDLAMRALVELGKKFI